MEGNLLRKLRENMKRLKKEEKSSRLPLLSSTTEEQRHTENGQVSRQTENIKMHVGHEEPAGHDLSFKIRSHQILQTKAQRLEIDLKRAREQSYIKTMEISKLLTEKEALELKIQELINKNLQLTREKEELCAEYEEKLSRKNSSDESIKLDKLRRENQSLSCKVLKYAGEKTELLRENNDLKDELYRKITVMSKLLSEKEELRIKNEMLMFKNLELTDEKELLCRAYEERLCREKQLRKGCCTSLMDKDQMVSPNSREYKIGFVSACQTSAVIIEDNSEALEQMKPQVVEYQLKEQWLKASVDNLKIKKSKGARQNILRWLQQTLENLKEDAAKLSRDTLAEWLKASLINLQEGCEWLVEREDVNGWLKVSISHLQEEGPTTCDLDVQEWIEASIIGIQHLQKFESESRGRLRKGWLEKSIQNLKNQCPEGFVNILEWLQGSLESLLVSEKPRPVLEKWFQQSLKNLQEEGPGTSKQDAKTWLEISIKNLEEEGPKTPHLDIQEWLEASIKGIQGLQKSKVEIRRTLRKGWFEKSIENLKKQCSEGPVENILQWLQGSLDSFSFSEEPVPLLEKWLQQSLKNLGKVLKHTNNICK